MSPEALLSLQLRYAQAAYLAAKHQRSAELLLEELARAARQDAQQEIAPSVVGSMPQDLLRNSDAARAEWGLIAAVARKLSLSHEHVRLVASGQRTSLRVERALQAELQSRKQQGEQVNDAERAA